MLINFPIINLDSAIHRLDPRTQILLLLAFSLAIVQSSNFWFILAGLLMALFYYSQAHLKWSETKQTWRFIITFVTIVTLFNYVISGGAVEQGVDLSNQHVLFSIPFIGFEQGFPFIGPAPVTFSVQSITFLITQAMRFFSIAMELRCFGIGKRTWFIKLHAHQIDRVLITLGILGFVATTILNILGYFYTQGPLHVLHTQGIPPFLLQ